MRRQSWLGIVLVFFLLAGCAQPAPQNPAIQEITLPLGYVANVQFSPFYMALDRGYFKEAGYDVKFDYQWETDGVRLVATGDIPFSVASGDQIIQARNQGLPVVAVASWFQRFPVAVIAGENHPLTTPADLKGLTIGTPVKFGASYIGLRALLKAGGLTEADVKIEEIGYTQLAALTAGTVDAVVVYANNEPVVLANQKVPFTALYVADYSNMVSNAIITSEDMIANHPDQVRAFVKAFLRGQADVLADPNATFEVCRKYVTGLDDNAANQKAVLTATLDYWRSEKPGQFTPEAWDQAQKTMLDAGLIEKETPVDAMFTNQFTQ